MPARSLRADVNAVKAAMRLTGAWHDTQGVRFDKMQGGPTGRCHHAFTLRPRFLHSPAARAVRNGLFIERGPRWCPPRQCVWFTWRFK